MRETLALVVDIMEPNNIDQTHHSKKTITSALTTVQVNHITMTTEVV